MKRWGVWAALCALGCFANGCNRVNGEKLADKVNEKMVAKIDKGEVKSESDLIWKELDALKEAFKDMGQEDGKITQSENKKYEEKVAKYKAEWSQRLAKKNGG